MRLEGLEVAQIGPRTGWLDVGREYDGSPGRERRTWLATVPEGRLAVTDGGCDVENRNGRARCSIRRRSGSMQAT